MNRRDFLTWVGIGGIASYLPVAMVACSPKTEESTSTTNSITNTTRADGFEPVGTVAQLDQDGEILNEKFSAGSILVVRDPGDSNTIIAVNPTCTHTGCTVKWQAEPTEFVCPCHDSKFAIDGTVIKGPAKDSLAGYEVKQEDDLILVKAG
ncbi:MAG: Rieske (2Fe-2S) protein [Coleofasciculus chthonoplastes F3-SA18-01]|jgi:cytochrome b6-f complex iron-sulfur subunit|uniref:QcrA and Rieske domain-containing protein n=1 Tax=Coleofasciculus chthonoplastes TaxID=64178 RepID=UPI003304450C